MLQAFDARGALLMQTFVIFRSKEDVERFRPHAMRAIEPIRKLDGCVGFGIGTDLVDDRTIRIYGQWRNEAGLKAYWGSAHRMALLDAVQALDPFTFNVKLFTPDKTDGTHTIEAGDSVRVLTPEEEARMSAHERLQQLVQVQIHFASDSDADRYIKGAQHAIAMSRKEPGNLEYGWSRDIDDLEIIRLAERWTDAARMYTHVKSKHGVALVDFIRTELKTKDTPDKPNVGQVFYIAPGMERDLALEQM